VSVNSVTLQPEAEAMTQHLPFSNFWLSLGWWKSKIRNTSEV